MALLNIGGVDMPTPSEFSVGIQDIVKAERNANGSMIKELIATKRKLELNWKNLTPAQLATLFSAVAANFFTVIYFDPITNASRTSTMYAGDRTCGMIDFQAGVPRYKDIKFNLIEK